MSEQYRLMVYFAVATLHLYRKDLIKIRKGQKYGVFAQKNDAVINRVCEEAMNLFGYELTHEQIGRAIKAYLAPGQSVSEREAATISTFPS